MNLRPAFHGVMLALAMLAACESAPVPTKITHMELSHEIDEHNEPRSARETFAPTSTIYVSIALEGTTPAKLDAKWTDPDGTVMAEQTQTVTPTDPPKRYEFHLLPEGGWKKSDRRYKLVVTLDGKEARTREFGIR